MTVQSDFSDAEWSTLIEGLVAPGVVVMALDPGLVSSAKELYAMIKSLLEAEARYPGVELIKALAGKSEKMESSAKPSEAVAAGQITEAMLAKVSEAIRLVDARTTPAEAQAYRSLMRDMARASAEASGSGLFGFGAKVSEAEAAFLKRLDAALA